MKKVLKVAGLFVVTILYIAAMFLCFKQAVNFFYNRYVMSFYNDRDYSINENLLTSVNILEPYIVYYNNANILYFNKQYEDAIDLYDEALSIGVPNSRECDVHINKSLSIIGLLPEDYEEYENIDDSIEILETARDVLFENECATKNGKGHSDKAEELREDIDEEIERLEKLKKQIESNMDEGEKQQRQIMDNMKPKDKKELEQYEEKVETEIEKDKKDEYKERVEELEKYIEMDIDTYSKDYSYDGIW